MILFCTNHLVTIICAIDNYDSGLGLKKNLTMIYFILLYNYLQLNNLEEKGKVKSKNNVLFNDFAKLIDRYNSVFVLLMVK